MKDCKYCSESFPDDDDGEIEYLDHLANAHADELTRIDEKRIKMSDSTEIEPEITLTEFLLQTVIIFTGLGLSLYITSVILL